MTEREHSFIELLVNAILTKWGLNVAPRKVGGREGDGSVAAADTRRRRRKKQ